MPKSKRNKVIALTKVDKVGFQAKEKLIGEIQGCIDTYASIYLFSVQNMRNTKLKEVRGLWKQDRFFFGKNKVMALAFGTDEANAYRPGLHQLASCVVGNVGILFTNKEHDDVSGWFSSFGEADYARAGDEATDDVVLPKGPLPQFSHSIEPHLRKLGMPTSLVRGVITLLKDYTVCTKGVKLNPEQARILKLLEITMAQFHITLTSRWTEDAGFEPLQRVLTE